MATLTQDQITELETEGYLLVKGALDPELDIAPVEREFAGILDRLANRLRDEGKITNTYPDLPFEERFIAVAAAAPEPIISNFEIALPNGGFTAETPINCGPATFNFLKSPRILDLMEPLIGSEIFCNPVQHTRIKLPPSVHAESRSGNLTDATQWHQDQGVVLAEADRTQTITVWAAMTDADEENGCLIYEQRSHHDGLGFHCPTDATNRSSRGAIPDEWIDMSRAIPVPAKRGDVLIHLPLTKHGSLDEHVQPDPLELRPALPPGRPAHRAGRCSRASSRGRSRTRRRCWTTPRVEGALGGRADEDPPGPMPEHLPLEHRRRRPAH